VLRQHVHLNDIKPISPLGTARRALLVPAIDLRCRRARDADV